MAANGLAMGIGIATSMRGRCILEGEVGEKREGRGLKGGFV